MRENCVNYYKTSRETAGYTQEQAAERLDISVRSLSAYENDEIIPPDDVVEKMVKLYNTKILGWWHLRRTSNLARECLPDVVLPQSNSDVYLQASLSQEDITNITKTLREILADGKITEDEFETYERVRAKAKVIAGKLISITNFDPVVG